MPVRNLLSIFTILFAAVAGYARAAEPTDWFHQAQWGVMTHYLGAPPSSAGGAELTAEMWNKQVDAFDVAGLVDQLASTGTKYLLFTLGQNSGHYCSPNATYDRIVGIVPSKCSRRDLIADLTKALAARDIRLMVYLPSGAPAADPVARKALGWRWGAKGGWQLPGEPVGGRLAEFQRNWEAVIREWSLRWGKSVSGWWIDGCYFSDQMYRFEDEPNFASFARALKAGNPEALVAFNPGVKVPVVCHTKYDDYTAGEVNLPQLAKVVDACPGRWLECDGRKVQFHILTYLGKTWCQGDQPQQPGEKIVALTRQLAEKGGVVTFDVPIQKSGLIPKPFVGQLRAIGQAMKEPADKPSRSGIAAKPGVNNGPETAWGRIWQDKKVDENIRSALRSVNAKRMSKNLFYLAKDPFPYRKLNFTLPGHQKNTLYEADDYLADQLQSWGYRVEREGVSVRPYRRDASKPKAAQYSSPKPEDPQRTAYNLYAEKRGRSRPEEIIVLVAHKDSQSWVDSPGANDNAIGTVGVLEMACVLMESAPERTIRFLFCNEEHTPWTSETAAKKAKERGDRIVGVFNMDGIGVKSEVDTRAGKKTNVTAFSAPEGERLAQLMSAVNAHYHIGLEQRAAKRPRPNDDDGSFVKAGYPAAVINIGSWPYADPNYHAEGDTPERCDVENAAMTVQATLAAVLTLDRDF